MVDSKRTDVLPMGVVAMNKTRSQCLANLGGPSSERLSRIRRRASSTQLRLRAIDLEDAKVDEVTTLCDAGKSNRGSIVIMPSFTSTLSRYLNAERCLTLLLNN
ncbi:hypothetical protein VTL71DRAFT_5390, partial [Oculimacula yallundae]